MLSFILVCEMHGTGPYMWREDVKWRQQKPLARLRKVKIVLLSKNTLQKKLYFIEKKIKEYLKTV